MKLTSRHLLGLDGMSKDEINLILDTAVSFKEVLERPQIFSPSPTMSWE